MVVILRLICMKFLIIFILCFSLNSVIGQEVVKKIDGNFINAYKDYKSSLQLDLNPDSTFKYVFHHSVGSCYARGIWKNNKDTIILIRNKNKNYSDSLEMRIFPNFIGKEKWFFKNDTLYMIDNLKLTNVKLIRN